MLKVQLKDLKNYKSEFPYFGVHVPIKGFVTSLLIFEKYESRYETGGN